MRHGRRRRPDRRRTSRWSVSELLPAPADAWVPDAAGRGYVSELRLLITDPATYRGVEPATYRGADPATVRGAK